MGIGNSAYFMLFVGDTLHVQRVCHGSIWHHDGPSLPLVAKIQKLMLELRDSKPDDGAIIKRCDSLAERFPIGGGA